GIDPSQAFVSATAEACKAHPNVRVLQGGGEDLTKLLAGKAVDVVRMDRVLQHLEQPTIRAVLSQVHAALRPGGVLIVTEPLWSSRHLDLGLDDPDCARVERGVYDVPQ